MMILPLLFQSAVPYSDAITTLATPLAELRKAVGFQRGWGSDSANWTAAQLNKVDDWIASAYRKFLAAHKWTFTHPYATTTWWGTVSVGITTISGSANSDGTQTLTATAATFFPTMQGKTITITGVGSFLIHEYVSATVIKVQAAASVSIGVPIPQTFSIASTGDYDLPADYAGLDMPFVHDSEWLGELEDRPANAILSWRAQNSSTGVPTTYARRAKTSAQDKIQRYEVMVFPVPGATYVMHYRYFVVPPKLTDFNPYPLGHALHGETLLQMCLAESEQKGDDVIGTHTAIAARCLQDSIRMDSNGQNPRFIGRTRRALRPDRGPYDWRYRKGLRGVYVA
jgi:hypothetical protein